MKTIATPNELESMLGEHLKALRLQKNLDRQTLCDRAGVSMNALRHLETGQGSTVKTLVRVVRALERQEWLAGVAPIASINPLHMVRDKPLRQRASPRSRGSGAQHGKNEKA
jgi:transcriptional regulator with XRE-family HTH domain